jgi:hypothetical protein
LIALGTDNELVAIKLAILTRHVLEAVFQISLFQNPKGNIVIEYFYRTFPVNLEAVCEIRIITGRNTRSLLREEKQ